MKPILIDLPVPIQTPRLLIRPLQAGDGKSTNAAILESFENIKEWLPWAKEKPTLEDSEERARQCHAKWILREDLTLALFEKASGKYVGGTGFHRINWSVPSFEIGYWVRNSFEGEGYISESTNALTRYAFQVMGAKRVELRCDTKNKRSIAVIERLGYEREGLLRNQFRTADGSGPRDMFVYSRLTLEGLPELEVIW